MKSNYLCKKARSSRSFGFTLIELLTVIAIIGILAAILIPVVNSVRATARASKCLSNVRQVTIAVIMYGDENGRMPFAASRGIDPNNPEDFIYWRNTREFRLADSPIAPYVGGTVESELLRCPDDKDVLDRDYAFSYAMNGHVAGNSSRLNYGATGVNGRISQIRDPSRVIVIVDEEEPDDGHFSPAQNSVASRHNDRGAVGFADGHVEMLTDQETKDAELFNPFFGQRTR